MPSAKYIGYLGGAAVAAGVGAAIAVAGQGTALADTDGGTSSASESSTSQKPKADSKAESTKADKSDKAETDTDSRDNADAADKDAVDAGPQRTSSNDKPTFDAASAVKELTKQFGMKPANDDDDDDEKDLEQDLEQGLETDPETTEDAAQEVEQAEEAAEPLPVFQPLSDLATKASEALAALPQPTAQAAAAEQDISDVDAAQTDQAVEVAAGPVPWSPNPFRPMPPEPAPNDMPGALWDIEQNLINSFESVPFLQPFVREGFEGGFRVSQMIPFVNAVIPVINIAGQLPNLASGDPVIFRDATQSIVNNLIVTVHPISVLFYGYDEIADLINVEYEAQQLKSLFYTTAWDVLDPFALLHNRGQSGLPMSPSSPTETPAETETPTDTETVQAAKFAAAVTDTADVSGSSPFRADDPDPIGMPASLLEARNAFSSLLPPELRPVYREGFEFVYRASQMVPYVNLVVPVSRILPVLPQIASGDKAGLQVTINQLLLTVAPVSILHYGFDQITDVLNLEETGFAAKQQIYADLWDALDPAGLLHNRGESGLTTVAV